MIAFFIMPSECDFILMLERRLYLIILEILSPILFLLDELTWV